MEKEKDRKIAVLIDADNVSEKYIKAIADELSNHGTPTYKRIYGDWTSTRLGNWKGVLLNYSITPIQQYSYTVGKNATDSALIIDAMDILYSKNVDGFCIVSSDSDFTRLASRLREAGMYVLGMGEKKTPPPFIAACEKFKYLEVLLKDAQKTEKTAEQLQMAEKKAMATVEELAETIRNIINEVSDDDGWAFLSDVGNRLSRRYPDFDTRNYGFTKLMPFIVSLKKFGVEKRKSGTSKINLIYVKNL